jgi:flagellin
MVINTNISATNSTRLLGTSTTLLTKSLSRLSSGSKIVSPEDDAAGLAQSIKFDAQINRNRAANTNVANAISFSQTQDGFLQKVQKALDRMSEISVLAQDKTKTTNDLSNYSAEFVQLQNYISDITSKNFNGVNLFSSSGLAITTDSDANTFGMNAANLTGALTTGAGGAGLGPSGDPADTISAIYDSQTAGVSVAVSSSTSAASALSYIKTAIQNLANMRANVGANIQRLTLTGEQLDILNENLTAANSRIKDVDVAEESTKFARYNILVQSGTAMLAQANALPQSALRLLGG